MKAEEKEYYEKKLIEAKQIVSDAGADGVMQRVEYTVAVFEKIASPLCYLKDELKKQPVLEKQPAPKKEEPKKEEPEKAESEKRIDAEKERLLDLGWSQTKNQDVLMLPDKKGLCFVNVKTDEHWNNYQKKR